MRDLRGVVDACIDALAVVFAIQLAVALGPLQSGTEQSLGDPSGPRAAEVLALIARLSIAPAGASADYDRTLFPHWIEQVPGCDTRCTVLDRDRLPVVDGLPGAGWRSLYDGHASDDASELEIDHIVPLAEAWVSGADRWSTAERQRFANDLTELLAVSSWSNQDKEAADPAHWRPPDRSAWCSYADRWVGVKVAYSLTADAAELDALTDMAGTCRR